MHAFARFFAFVLLPGVVASAPLAGCNESSDDVRAGTPDEVTSGGYGRKPLVATVETPNESGVSNMDDPAVWVHPSQRSKSLIVAAAKFGGMRAYDLKGKEVGRIDPPLDAAGKPTNRFNNVDVQYDFDLNGKRVDLAVASDRLRDKLAIFRIDPAAPGGPLVDVTDPAIGRAFPTRPNPDDRTQTVENPDNGKSTAYGLALWRDRANDKLYALVSQNGEAIVSQFELVARPDDTIGATLVRSFMFPYEHRGQDLTQEDDVDPARDFSPQFEGMAVDQQTGILYAGQEDVGIWRVDLVAGVAEEAPFYETSAFDPTSRIARDVEGLTIFYGEYGEGYLLASSQGQAHGEPPLAPSPGLDDTFVVFRREGGNEFLGSFGVGANAKAGIDAVQECDGAAVLNVALPGFPYGLFVAQDGYDNDLNDLDGSVDSTNLKITPWERIADNFPGGPLDKTVVRDPRDL